MLYIQNGRVVDPVTGKDEIQDILVKDGRIDKEAATLMAIHPETVERQARFMR